MPLRKMCGALWQLSACSLMESFIANGDELLPKGLHWFWAPLTMIPKPVQAVLLLHSTSSFQHLKTKQYLHSVACTEHADAFEDT